MRGNRKRGWLAAVALGLGALTGPSAHGGPPVAPPVGSAVDLEEVRRLTAQADELFAKGKYGEALPLAQRALDLREAALGPDHPDVALSLSSLAMLYVEKGDYARAEPLLQRALVLTENALGKDHVQVALVVNNLGALYFRKRDFTRAEPLLQRALGLWEKAQGEGSPAFAKGLNNLAALYQESGAYARAEPLHLRALALREKALGPDNLDVANSLFNLASLYHRESDYARAEPLYQRALVILEKVLGEDHPVYAKALDHLAFLYRGQGRLAEAVQAKQRSMEIEDRNAAILLATGSETQKRAYMATLTDSLAGAISLHLQSAPSDPQAARLALSAILRRKGRILDAMTDGFASLRRHLGAGDQALLDQLASVRSEIGARLWRGPGALSGEGLRDELKALEEKRIQLDEAIGARSALYRTEQQQLPSLEQIAAAIPEGAALVEILRTLSIAPNSARGSEPHYVAYVLRRSGAPSFADLGSAPALDAAAGALRAKLADPNLTHDPRPAARALDAMLMQPIRALLGDTRWVLLSPDGDLHLVPFEALLDEQGHFLVERFAFTYLGSGRDLVRFQTHAEPRQGIVVAADPDFGAAPVPRSDQGAASAQRGLRSIDLTGVSFASLPGTAKEARAIGRLFPSARLLLQAQATEEAVKAVQAPSILHLATHGFFLPQAPAALQSENPLLRAGLALAGANARASGASDDGILTALEASGLDLYGTRLVVLSACETGLGDAVSGDGVYGLRRALGMAGAEAQVMSLWEVADQTAVSLMSAYYEKLQAGGGRSEALRQVELEMLGRPETAHPHQWASFIASGNWRSLEGGAVTPDFRVHPGMRACACTEAGGESRGSWQGLSLALVALSGALRRRLGLKSTQA